MTYTVKQGDTLYGISNQYGVSANELAKINNITNNILKIGQILTIPNNSGTNPDSMFIYTVTKGDNLYNIAKKYNTTVQEIIKLNNLKSTNLSIGQKIKIPEKYTNAGTLPNYTNYTVKKGDTLYKIANNFNISVDQIMKDNNLNMTLLQIGDNLKIRIPNNEVLQCIGESWEPNIDIKYTVQKGDSLYSIANKFNTTVEKLKKKNNLKSNLLNIGQVLYI